MAKAVVLQGIASILELLGIILLESGSIVES